MSKNIEWTGWYIDDENIAYDLWFCNICNIEIDDKKQEIEMHQCKQ